MRKYFVDLVQRILIFGFVVMLYMQMFDGSVSAFRTDNHHGQRKLTEFEICELEKEIRELVKCPEGQLPDHNGKCRDVWKVSSDACSEGYRLGENDECSEVWSFNIIKAPTYCPEGYQLYNGKCRRIF